MEILTGAALVCVAASIAIWANDNLPHSDKDEFSLETAPADHLTH